MTTVPDGRGQAPEKRVTIAGRTFHVVEGDLLVEEDEFASYMRERERRQAEGTAAVRDWRRLLDDDDASEDDDEETLSYLLGMEEEGKLVRWRPGLELSYRVVRATFPDDDRYQQVRTAMSEAAEAWESVCGVQFRYLAELDAAEDGHRPLFDVIHHDAGGQFIAAAFFPNDPPDQRWVLIDPSYYSPRLRFDRVGVLRHELGHVLGFRHEHIRSGAPPICPDEDTTGTFELSRYDPNSVMHYFCGGVGQPELEITRTDRYAARRLYGPALRKFRFYE